MRKSLKAKRTAIDRIDQKILYWLQQRTKVVDSISDLKKNQSWPIQDKEREKEILRRLVAANEGPLTKTEITHIFNGLFKLYRQRQKKKIPGKQK